MENRCWLECPPVGHSPTTLHTHEVTGSSPVVSTKNKRYPFGWRLFFMKRGARTHLTAICRWHIAKTSSKTGFLHTILPKAAKLAIESRSLWGADILQNTIILRPHACLPILMIGMRSRESLNKSSAAEQRIFSPSCAVSKVGNTYSIPPLLILSSGEKSLAVSFCRFNQSFPKNAFKNQIKWTAGAFIKSNGEVFLHPSVFL